jgi:hypothetical protein
LAPLPTPRIDQTKEKGQTKIYKTIQRYVKKEQHEHGVYLISVSVLLFVYNTFQTEGSNIQLKPLNYILSIKFVNVLLSLHVYHFVASEIHNTQFHRLAYWISDDIIHFRTLILLLFKVNIKMYYFYSEIIYMRK